MCRHFKESLRNSPTSIVASIVKTNHKHIHTFDMVIARSDLMSLYRINSKKKGSEELQKGNFSKHL